MKVIKIGESWSGGLMGFGKEIRFHLRHNGTQWGGGVVDRGVTLRKITLLCKEYIGRY